MQTVRVFGPGSPDVMDIKDHWLAGARRSLSPNCDERPADAKVELVVIHGISLPPGYFGGDAIEKFFCNRLTPDEHGDHVSLRDLRVSSHLLIRRIGACIQFVPFHMRAWHAGRSSWRGREGCNDFSVGIELEGTDETPYTPAQYAALAAAIRALRTAYPALNADAVVGHMHVAPGRKTDPGSAFDWARLRAMTH